MQIEYHPFSPFVPDHMQTLILGSFPGKEQTQTAANEQWFYGAPRNQFWKIIEGVYDKKLDSTMEKQQLFSTLKIGITDIILKAKRLDNSNLDQNLEVVEWNTIVIERLLRQYPAAKILCTGKFVENHFKKFFPSAADVQCLPSPSPRYAIMSLQKKIAAYKKMLPSLIPKNS